MKKVIIPFWFKVGCSVWFHGVGGETKVLSIDKDDSSWVGSDHGDKAKYPLDEVAEHWAPLYIDDGK